MTPIGRLHCACFVIASFLCTPSHATEESSNAPVSAEELAQAIPQELKHPYLYMPSGGVEELRAQIAEDPLSAQIYAAIKNRADAIMVVATPPRRPDLQALAFTHVVTGDRRYAQKAFELLRYPPVNPGGFDLKTSRACRTLAIMYDWLYAGLDEDQREELRSELQAQVDLIRGKYPETWWTHAYRTNWNAVCHSSAGVAALALLPDDPSLTEVLAASYNGITRTYDEIGQDGGWQEGVSYYSYALFVSLLYSGALERITDGEFNLVEHPRVQQSGLDLILYSLIPPVKEPGNDNRAWKPVGFQDSSPDRREEKAFGYSLLAEAGVPYAAWLRQQLYSDEGDLTAFDILWPASDLQPETAPTETSKAFRDYGLVFLRGSFTDASDLFLAGISGPHWDPTREMLLLRHRGAEPIPVSEKPWGMEIDTFHHSHSHRNAGHFHLYKDGIDYLTEYPDIGYTSSYWYADRWGRFPNTDSRSKNVVTVNGEQQTSGWFLGGDIRSFNLSDELDYAVFDNTGAYPGEHLKLWHRHLIRRSPDVALLFDEIETAQAGDTIRFRFHTGVETTLEKDFLFLSGNEGGIALIPLLDSEWNIEEGTHPIPEEISKQMRERVRDHPGRSYIDIVTQAPETKSIAAFLMFPVETPEEARGIVDSVSFIENADTNRVILSLTRKGQTIDFRFNKRDSGHYELISPPSTPPGQG